MESFGLKNRPSEQFKGGPKNGEAMFEFILGLLIGLVVLVTVMIGD